MSWIVGAMRRWLARHPVPGPPEDVGPLTERQFWLDEQARLLRLRRSLRRHPPADAEEEEWARETERRWLLCQQRLADFSLQGRQTRLESSKSQQRRQE